MFEWINNTYPPGFASDGVSLEVNPLGNKLIGPRVVSRAREIAEQQNISLREALKLAKKEITGK